MGAVMRLYLFVTGTTGTRCWPIGAREVNREYADTDAGLTWGQPTFVVQAASEADALDGARRWVACWEDEDEAHVPDDLSLVERQYKPGKTHMILRVA
jgi:hypothetical protein